MEVVLLDSNPTQTLAILVTTFAPPGGSLRIKAVERAVKSWKKYLRFGGAVHVHVSDDGSDPALKFDRPFWEKLIGDWASLSYTRQEAGGVGASFNAGLAKCFAVTPLVLYPTDDWSLTHNLDVSPWAQLLSENEGVGCIRLGVASPWLRGGEIKLFTQGWTISFDRYSYYWCLRPALYHKRFFDCYGPLPEGVNAFEVDRLYNDVIVGTPGPDILLSLLSPWQHLWSVELGDLEPGDKVPAARLEGTVRTDG